MAEEDKNRSTDELTYEVNWDKIYRKYDVNIDNLDEDELRQYILQMSIGRESEK